MKNLLVLTDFSPESRYAFDAALQLARRTRGRVVVLHVLELPETANFSTFGGPVSGGELPGGGGGLDDVFVLRLLQVVKRRMHRLLDDAAGQAPQVLVTDRVSTRSLREAVTETVAQEGIDLLVMGAQGHTPLEHFLLGSNTERMVRLAPCPVLAVKHPAGDLAVRRLVFPSDFAPEADAAASQLRDVQALFPDARLDLLHIIRPANDYEAAWARITDFANRHGLREAQPVVREAASPAAGIAAYTQEVSPDLLLVPTHGRTGLSRWLQASIAEHVATHTFPPVLTVRL